MPDEPITPTAATDAPPSLVVPQLPKRRTRKSLPLDRDEIAAHVVERLDEDLEDRQDELTRYLDTYVRYRGFLPAKDWPWENAANAHIPVTMYNARRLQAALLNAVLSNRPVMSAQAWSKANHDRESRVDSFLDWQVFVEMRAEPALDSFIHNFVVDPMAVAYIPWVRERGIVTDLRVVGPIPVEPVGLIQSLEKHLRALVPGLITVTPTPQNPNVFTFAYLDGKVLRDGDGEVFDRDDGRSEIKITRQVTKYDGPQIQVLDFEDVVVPSHAANMQPRDGENPRGAAHVSVLTYLTTEEIRRRKKDGEFDLLDDKDIEGLPEEPQEVDDRITEAKRTRDEVGGQQSIEGRSSVTPHTLVTHYGRWDVDGDGLEEECIFWVIKEQKLLCAARLLRERFPSGRRPFGEGRMFPIPNRFYGESLARLAEGLADVIDTLFNQALDYGTISNAPFGFYRPSGSLKPEILRYAPGELIPLDNPQQDMVFPQMPNANQAWAINLINLATQFLERQTGQGGIQFGQVPTGKASALRTVGTTAALLMQGDVLTEQVLRRLFMALAEIWAQVFCLDQAFLLPGKEFRILGQAEEGAEVFDTIKSTEELAGRYTFDFRASMLHSNPQVRQQVATAMLQALVSPLLIQTGIVTPEEMYHLAANFLRAHKEPMVDRYIRKPPQASQGPRMTAEDVVSAALAGDIPEGVNPVEPPEQHLEKLVRFLQTGQMIESGPLAGTDQRILLGKAGLILLQAYVMRVQQAVAQQAQLQQLVQLAGGFQQQMGGGVGQGGGQMTMGQEPTPGEGIGMDGTMGEGR